jgi:chemotaxis methyl-accepting protein methylase
MTDIEEASLDFVVCKFSLCEMDTETYMKNLVQLKKKLKKGGYLII